MKTKKTASIVTCLLLAAFLVNATRLASAGDTSGGSLVVGNAAPSIGLGSLWDSTDSTNKNNTNIDVWTELHINYTLTDQNTLYDLLTSYVTIWDSGQTTQGGADDVSKHYTFVYTNSTDAWTEVGPGSTHIISGSCVKPADRSQATGTYKLAFKLDYVASYTATKTWTACVNVTDSASNTDSNTTIIFGVTFYSGLNVVDTVHEWAGANPGDTDKVLTTPADGKIDITVTANAVWHLQGKGSADLNDGNGHTIPIGNIKMHKDTLGSATSMTTEYANIGGLTNQAAGSNLNVYVTLWATVPQGQASGIYTYTFSVQVAQGAS